MRTMWKTTLTALALAVGLAAAGCSDQPPPTPPAPSRTNTEQGPRPAHSAPASPGRAEVGDSAEEFSLQDLSGRTVRLSDYKGKVVVVDFWATWCPPCRQEIPGFVKLHRQYRDRGVEFVGISFDRAAAPVRQFASTYGVTYPIVLGTPEVAMAYGGVDAIPTTFVIDREGRITAKHTGFAPPDVFAGAIESAL